jgi:hypothetical protein
MEETKGEKAWTFFAIILAGTVAAVLHYAEQGTDNLLHRPAKSIVRDTMAPVFNDEMVRKLAKVNRPTGGEMYFKPVRIIYVDKAELENPCLAGNCHGEVSPVYSSSLDSLIIRDGMK